MKKWNNIKYNNSTNKYTYIKCDKRVAKLDKINYEKLKEKKLNQYFLIYSEKLLKRLNNDANILLIEKIKWKLLKK